MITEKLGPIATSNTNWKIIQKINLEIYFSTANTLMNQMRLIMRLCNANEVRCDSAAHLENLQARILKTSKQADRLVYLIQGHGYRKNAARTQRSILPVIGKISKFLFGTLDESSEAELYNAIETTGNNTNMLAALLSNQTELVAHKLADLYDKHDMLTRAVEQLKIKIDSDDHQNALREATEAVTDNLIQYDIDTEMLTDAILFATRGIIHPRFLPSDFVERTAELVSNTVGSAEFPAWQGTMSAVELLDISDLSIIFINRTLIYRVVIPLLNPKKYELIKASPVPVVQTSKNNTKLSAYIQPNLQFFAISLTQKSYIPFTNVEIGSCKTLRAMRICKHVEPVRAIDADTPCEVKIATGAHLDNLQQCDVRLKQLHSTFWLRLHESNTWIFSVAISETLFIQCGNFEQITIELVGTGILKLKPGCSANSRSSQLHADREFVARNPVIPYHSIALNISAMLQAANVSEFYASEAQAALHPPRSFIRSTGLPN